VFVGLVKFIYFNFILFLLFLFFFRFFVVALFLLSISLNKDEYIIAVVIRATVMIHYYYSHYYEIS